MPENSMNLQKTKDFPRARSFFTDKEKNLPATKKMINDVKFAEKIPELL
jgi:hypothetical protein